MLGRAQAGAMPDTKYPQFSMQAGEKLGRPPNHPIVSVVRDGPRTYLWVGNDMPNDMMCFATMQGPAKLRKLAQAILSGLNGKRK